MVKEWTKKKKSKIEWNFISFFLPFYLGLCRVTINFFFTFLHGLCAIFGMTESEETKKRHKHEKISPKEYDKKKIHRDRKKMARKIREKTWTKWHKRIVIKMCVFIDAKSANNRNGTTQKYESKIKRTRRKSEKCLFFAQMRFALFSNRDVSARILCPCNQFS